MPAAALVGSFGREYRFDVAIDSLDKVRGLSGWFLRVWLNVFGEAVENIIIVVLFVGVVYVFLFFGALHFKFEL